MGSNKRFEFILNGKNWSGPEANLTILIYSLPSLKKCNNCDKEKKNIMSSSLKGGSWDGSWLNYCRECCLARLEKLRTSSFLKEIGLLLEVEKFIRQSKLISKKW